MKIGVITFHDSPNYGAALQAYALQKSINSFAKCEIVNYISDTLSYKSKLKKVQQDNSFKGLMKKRLYYNYYRNRFALFSNFIADHCNITEEYTKNNISKANERFDCFISGSDQVFNLNITHQDYTYYLDFVAEGIGKVGYAVSSGNYIINEGDKNTIKYIQSFDSILCREPRLLDVLSKFGVKHLALTLDPTFLLERSEWIEIEQPINMPKEFVLAYFVSPRKDDIEYAKRLGKVKKLPVYYVNYDHKKYGGIHNLTLISPNQLLYLFHQANIVVTNSFHGTALSINYGKKFCTIFAPDREVGNERMANILHLLHLEECKVYYNEKPKIFNYNDNQVQLCMEELRINSYQTLRKTIENVGKTNDLINRR